MTTNTDFSGTNSISLSLENLTLQYNNLINNYEQAIADYNNLLKNNVTPSSTLTAINGKSFLGTGPITDSSNNNINKSNLKNCISACQSSTTCTGATFNSTTQMCSLRTGEGKMTPSNKYTYAIVPQQLILLSNIDNINNQLINLNTQMLQIAQNGQPIFNSQNNTIYSNSQQLVKNFNNLNKERQNIEKLVKQFEDLDKEQANGDIRLNQNYYSFLLLICITVVIIIALFKLPSWLSNGIHINITSVMPHEQKIYYIITTIIILLIAGYYISKKIFLTNINSGTYYVSNIGSSIITSF